MILLILLLIPKFTHSMMRVKSSLTRLVIYTHTPSVDAYIFLILSTSPILCYTTFCKHRLTYLHRWRLILLTTRQSVLVVKIVRLASLLLLTRKLHPWVLLLRCAWTVFRRPNIYPKCGRELSRLNVEPNLKNAVCMLQHARMIPKSKWLPGLLYW